MLDKTIALAIGRPFAIVDQQCLVKRATNVWLDDETDESAFRVSELLLSQPTLSLCSSLAHDLAKIIGDIQEKCFGLLSVSYETVLSLDHEVLRLETKLPPYFRLKDADTSMDHLHAFFYIGTDSTYTRSVILHASRYTGPTCYTRASPIDLKQATKPEYLQRAQILPCEQTTSNDRFTID